MVQAMRLFPKGAGELRAGLRVNRDEDGLGNFVRHRWSCANERNVARVGGIELATGKRIGPAELRAANPTLSESCDPRRVAKLNHHHDVSAAELPIKGKAAGGIAINHLPAPSIFV